jgi:uncharacterized protein YdaL
MTGKETLLFMRRFSLAVVLGLLFLAGIAASARAYASGPDEAPAAAKKVLVLFEGSDVPANYARGDARELAMLLGHFHVSYQVKGVQSYTAGDIGKADIAFFIGYKIGRAHV